MILAGLLTVSLFDAASAGRINTSGICERQFASAAKRHGVPVAVLAAVGLTETGRGDGLRPYALNINGKAIYDLSRNEAMQEFYAARKRGIKLIDVGCMQINHHYHKRHFRSVAEMLEPAKNVDYAARFLKRLYNREKNWTRAVARYHASERNKPAQKRYICAVIGKLVAAKLGGWTAEAAKFCGVGQASGKSLRRSTAADPAVLMRNEWMAEVNRGDKNVSR